MSVEKRLEIVKQIQVVNEKQLANRHNALELSQQLEKDVGNMVVKEEIEKLERENSELFAESKRLVNEL